MKNVTFHRMRECEACGGKLLTAEISMMRQTDSKADRCPECIVGLGHVDRTTYAWKRAVDGRACNPPADQAGALVRRRACSNGCTKQHKGKTRPVRWTTWEVRADGYASKDVTICPCGGVMKVLGEWNPYLERMQ